MKPTNKRDKTDTRNAYPSLLEVLWVQGNVLIEAMMHLTPPDALRFYESLGFEATHEGFKLKLNRS